MANLHAAAKLKPAIFLVTHTRGRVRTIQSILASLLSAYDFWVNDALLPHQLVTATVMSGIYVVRVDQAIALLQAVQVAADTHGCLGSTLSTKVSIGWHVGGAANAVLATAVRLRREKFSTRVHAINSC